MKKDKPSPGCGFDGAGYTVGSKEHTKAFRDHMQECDPCMRQFARRMLGKLRMKHKTKK